MALNIVLVEPEIPQNAGNIARTCAVTGSKLHLVRPLGFEVTDKHLKRAGLDYWHFVDISYYDSIEEVMDKFYNGKNFWFFSTKAKKIHSEIQIKDGDFLVFGKETKGLPESLLEKHYDECTRIPMMNDTRSLNLSNSVCVGVYEGLRQLGYPNLQTEGEIPKR
ncbi:MAG: tRNA (uridine(34)/cytosine(34)/5-carboxymethylaminomethyluridine(34)-2'-O)-methyltransferase TrmL [Clostridiales bacterium]|nr:tRNA (uridine(34)/cytosine(34)/5-carboxymethylaminomethyluridine(34)-2'-O)-methyltransferase TrmL [Clostridiales bacterium]